MAKSSSSGAYLDITSKYLVIAPSPGAQLIEVRITALLDMTLKQMSRVMVIFAS
jgi:hypothetical protein